MKQRLQRSIRALKAFPFLAIVSIAACTPPPPETLALQCITGSAEWSPLVVDFAQSRIGPHPATITDSQIRWETVNHNGFGGATRTQYGINRDSGLVTADHTYVDSHGKSMPEPGRYAGECYVRKRPF